MIRESRGKSENNYVGSMATKGSDQLRHLSESTTAKADLEGVELQQRATRGESWFEPRMGNSKFGPSTSEQSKEGKARRENHRIPAAGGTNSRVCLQVAGIQRALD